MIEQGSEEWIKARLGKVTASRISDVIAKTKTGYGASRANYMAELLVERLTKEQAPQFVNDAMRWGTDQEPSARDAYEFRFDTTIQPAGFVEHPSIALSGSSPDGFIGDAGLIEIKCPNTATHIETLLGATVPQKYISQMMWQMACADRQWCDFVSFDPRLPEQMRLFVYRIQRDEKVIRDLEAEVKIFLSELNEKETILTEKYLRQSRAA